MKLIVLIVLCITINNKYILAWTSSNSEDYLDYMEPEEHVYPYMAAILRKSTFISAGVLIDEKWVLTAADSLFFIREAIRTLRVRLGSTNYKHGGTLSAVKFLFIHPSFDDKKPEFDLALVRLSEDVRFTPDLKPIQMQKRPRHTSATHFTIIGWHSPTLVQSPNKFISKESLQQLQFLTVSRLHPSERNDCLDRLKMLEANNTDTVMCLDWAVTDDPCQRDIGAAVILNGVLWGIASSWKTEACVVEKDPLFVSLVSSVKISSWIHSTIHGHRWSQKHTVDYHDNFI